MPRASAAVIRRQKATLKCLPALCSTGHLLALHSCFQNGPCKQFAEGCSDTAARYGKEAQGDGPEVRFMQGDCNIVDYWLMLPNATISMQYNAYWQAFVTVSASGIAFGVVESLSEDPAAPSTACCQP